METDFRFVAFVGEGDASLEDADFLRWITGFGTGVLTTTKLYAAFFSSGVIRSGSLRIFGPDLKEETEKM